MWSIDTSWFDLAIVLGLFALGNIYFGYFEEHRPKWYRALKIVFFSIFLVNISVNYGRVWFFAALGVCALVILFRHAWWLPKNGVNGLTGEPREKYYALIGRKKGEEGGSNP